MEDGRDVRSTAMVLESATRTWRSGRRSRGNGEEDAQTSIISSKLRPHPLIRVH